MTKQILDELMKHSIDYPLMKEFGYRVTDLSDGYCELHAPRNKDHDGIFRSFHGGLLATVADTTACFSVLTRFGVQAKLSTIDMHVRYIAPCLTGCVARAQVLKFGKNLCPTHCDLFDENDRLVAVAQVGYIKVHKTASE